MSWSKQPLASQLALDWEFNDPSPCETPGNGDNALQPQDRAFHDWYRFVLSYPPHLVRDYLRDFDLDERSTILDPFCGTGTTLVEARLHHIRAIGLEANPFPQFASKVKTDWDIAPDELQSWASQVAQSTYAELSQQGIDDRALICDPGARLETLPPQAMQVLIKNSISPLPLHKTLVLLEQIRRYQETRMYAYAVLALGNALVTAIGNLRFGPEVGIGKIKRDVPVVAVWLNEMKKINRSFWAFSRTCPNCEISRKHCCGPIRGVFTRPMMMINGWPIFPKFNGWPQKLKHAGSN